MLGGGVSGAWQLPGRVSVVPGGHSSPGLMRVRVPPGPCCAAVAAPMAATVSRASTTVDRGMMSPVARWRPLTSLWGVDPAILVHTHQTVHVGGGNGP